MRYMKTVFGLVIVAGLMAVAASPAVAATPKWVTCEEVSSGTWTNSTCTTSGSGKFETKALAETREVTSSGTLILQDTAQSTTLSCTGSGLGTAGAEGTDGIKTITATACKFVEKKHGSCEETGTVLAKAVNLPWATQLEEVENTKTKTKEVRDSITSLVAGKESGWAVECTVAKVLKITDTCEGNTSTSARANRTEGTVETEFDKVSEEKPATCSVGKGKTGLVGGTVINRLRRPLGWFILAPVLGT